MSALITASFAFLPGAFFSLLLRKRPSLSGFVTDSIAFSLLADCAIFWVPILGHLHFDVWVEVLYALSVLGFISLPIVLMRIDWAPLVRVSRYQAALRLASISALAFYTLIVLVRANIDWDAINYYLFDAVNFVKSNQVGLYFSHWVVPVFGAPNTQPPALPILYAAAIDTAARLHESADLAVRLLSVTFVVGLWAAVHRLAGRYLTAAGSDAAALLSVTLPMLAALVVATPLYLDIAITFLSAAVLTEFAYLERTRRGWLRIALYASATILTKITGLGIVIFAAFAFALSRLRGGLAALAVALLYVAFVAASLRLGFFVNVVSIWLVLALCAIFSLTVWGLYAHAAPKAWKAPTFLRTALVVLGLLPGLAFIGELIWLTGSPAGGYVQSVTRVASPNWNWALHTIAASTPYISAIRPGLPQHFGLGLLFWWGLAPATNLLAILGLIRAIRDHSPIVPIGIAGLIYEFAWLTIFRLDDFRHLLPIAPVVAVLAVYGLQRLVSEREDAVFWGAIGLIGAAIPFAWIAQETFFTISYPILLPLDWTQYFSLSTKALWNIALYCAFIAAMFFIRWSQANQAWARYRICAAIAGGASLVALFFFSVPVAGALLVAAAIALATVRPWPRLIRFAAVPLCAIAVILATFEPVLATGFGEGFGPHENAVRANEDGSYIGALANVPVVDPSVGTSRSGPATIMTYLGYGITWFSLGALRPFEMNDALILGRLKGDMPKNDLPSLYRILGRYNITSAILPARTERPFVSFARLLGLSRLDVLYALYDPLLTIDVRSGLWRTLKIYPRSTGALSRQADVMLRRNERSISISREDAAFAEQTASYEHMWVRVPRAALDSSAPAFVRVTFSDAATAAPKALEFESMPKGGEIPIDLRKLFANKPDGTELSLRSIDVKYESSELDFRSGGFPLQRLGNGYRIGTGAEPFVLFPESSPIRDISIAPSPSAQGITFYPTVPTGSFINADPYLNITLRGSYGCGNGGEVRVNATGTFRDMRTRKSVPYSAVVVARIPSVAFIRLVHFAPVRHSTRATITLRQIVVNGIAPKCAIRAAVDARNLALSSSAPRLFRIDGQPIERMVLESVTRK